MKIHRANSSVVTESLYGGDGVVTWETYFADSSKLSVFTRYEMAPGAAEGAHFHEAGVDGSCTPHSSDELYFVTEGELVMTVDGESETLQAGDAAYAPARSVHGIRNYSDRPAKVVVVWQGPPSSEVLA